jgi:hypothetical protein
MGKNCVATSPNPVDRSGTKTLSTYRAARVSARSTPPSRALSIIGPVAAKKDIVLAWTVLLLKDQKFRSFQIVVWLLLSRFVMRDTCFCSVLKFLIIW